MPGFLNLPFAALAAAIAIPSLLLLYFLRLRRKEASVSSTLLWRKTIEDLQVNAPFQRLRKNLLLLLQLLLLVLLCVALARPVKNISAGPGRRSILLIDHSASMNAKENSGKTRLELAKRYADELVDRMGRDSGASVIAFTDDAQVVQPMTSDRTALKNAIDSIQPTDRPTKFETAYRLADAQGGGVEVWLLSDGRASDVDRARVRGTLHEETIGTPQTDNVAIVAMDARRNYDDPTQVQIFVRLANFGSQVTTPDVQLSVAPMDPGGKLNWQVVRVASSCLLPTSWTPTQREEAQKAQNLKPKDSVEFDLNLTSAAALKVQQMHRDAVSADDIAEAIVPPPRQLRALLVTTGNYFLERALNSLDLRQPAIVTPDQYEASWKDAKTSPANYDVILFDAYVPKRLPTDGNFIWFGVVPDGIGVTAEKSGKDFLHIQDARFLDWQTDHPILRGLSLQSVQLRDTLNLKLNSNADALAQGLRGPLIVLDRENRQTHLIVGFDLWESDWPEHVSFPIFMRNAMQFMALGSAMNVQASYQPGQTPRIARASLAKLGDVKQLTLTTPDGAQIVNIPPAGDVVLPALNHVGIYSLEPPLAGFEHLAVNLLDSNESNLSPLDVRGAGAAGSTAGGDKTQSDLWRWLIACSVLPLLMIEWWVYTRRMHM